MAIYAEIGSSFQQVGGTQPDGFITMSEQRPTIDHVAASDGTWTIGLAQYKSKADVEYEAVVDLDLTIDSREILISPLYYNIMTGFASSNMASVEIMLADGTHHIYTAAEFTAMWNKVNEYKHACGVRRRALYAELEAAEDMSAVDLTTGWPTTTYTTV